MEHLTFDELLKYSKRTIREMRDSNNMLKKEYKDLIEKVNKHVSVCPECKEIIMKLQQTKDPNTIKRLKALYELRNNKLTEEEQISKQYGISLERIEHIRLDNGEEYYHFYDINLNKDIVLSKNDKDKNLSEEFKDIQSQIESAQSDNAMSNGEEVFKYQRMHTNNEVEMIPVNELIAKPELLGNITVEQMKKVSILLKNKDALELISINPETGIAVNRDHKIVSAEYSRENQQYRVIAPTEYKYQNDNISSVDNVSVDSNVDTTDVMEDEVEVAYDFPEEYNGYVIDKQRVKLYYEYPEMLDSETLLTVEEKAAYMAVIKNYNEKVQSSQNMTNTDVKKKVFTNKQQVFNQAGYANLLLLSLITGFVGGILTSLMLIIIK